MAEDPNVAPPALNLPPGFKVGAFKNSRSQTLFTLQHPPPKGTSTKAVLVFVHGLVEHCCREGYLQMFKTFAAAGIDVHSFDLHGHGRSEGKRGYVQKIDHYVEDLLGFIKDCQKKYVHIGETCPPLVIMGHSMGGLISVLAASSWLGNDKAELAGLVLTSPALGVDKNLVLTIQHYLAPAINVFIPESKIVPCVLPKDMSRCPEAVQKLINDPLIQKGKIMLHTALQVDSNFYTAKKMRGEITCPTLILHGTEDRCTSLKASLDFFHNIASSKKRFLRLPGVFHEMYEDPEVDQIMPSIVQFVSSGGKQFANIDGREDHEVIHFVFK